MAKIVGVVRNGREEPLEDVRLKFIGIGETNDGDELDTESDGSFKTKILKAGNYSWTAEKEGFVTNTGEVTGLPAGSANFPIKAMVLNELITPPSSSSSSTSTSSTTSSSTTSSTSTTSATTVTTESTSATTITEPPDDEFVKLTNLIIKDEFGLIPPVSIEEAIEFMKLYRVGNYTMVNLIGCIENLDSALKNGPEIVEKGKKLDFLNLYSGTIDSILGERTIQGQPSKVETEVMVDMRQQFDIGTASATNVNTEFKTIFKRLVGLCNDELLAVDPKDAAANSPLSFGPKQQEESYKFLRNLKKEIINLTQNMSYAGTLGTRPLVKKMAAIQYESLNLIQKFGEIYLASGDEDARHYKSIIARLNGVQASDIEPFLVHAKEGCMMLDYVIKTYAQIKNFNKVGDDSDEYLRELFFVKTPLGSDKKVNTALRENASLVMQYWPKNWG